jgi:hypothetical protein
MTRTGRVSALMAHAPEPRLSIHPADAAQVGLTQEGLAWVETAEGAVLLRADLTHTQRLGEIFAPMHWTDAFASGLAEMPNGEALTDFVHNLVPAAPGQEWMEIRDPARRVLRAAALQDGRLEAALFLAPDRARLPRAEAVIPLLGALVPDAVRALLLAGRPPAITPLPLQT